MEETAFAVRPAKAGIQKSLFLNNTGFPITTSGMTNRDFCKSLILLSFTVSANAELNLLGQGTSTHGTYNLIYDTDYNITWYDFSYSLSGWDNSVAWADALSVTFGSNTYSDWRLPTALNQNGSGICNGAGNEPGFNCIENELGHLYYTELGNLGWYDYAKGDGPQSGWGLNKTGDFQNLLKEEYWTGTELTNPILAMWYDMKYGYQYPGNKNAPDFYSVAVRNGLAVVPEPLSSILFITGGGLLAGRRYMRRIQLIISGN